MEDIDMDDNYTDGYENYCILHRTVTFLKNGGKVTEQWMVEHREHILRYRKEFADFSKVHPEIDDETFRSWATETEKCMINLMNSIRASGFFSIPIYLKLNELIINICDFVFTEDELQLCMNKLSI